MVIAAWVIAAFLFVGLAYTVYAMRKLGKNQTKPESGQLEGNIAQYGAKATGVFGSPMLYGNHVAAFDKYTRDIQKKSGK